MRAIGMDPVHDTQSCFRALVSTMSRPGTTAETPVSPADHAVLATLVDHEVTCHTTDEEIRSALADQGRLTAAERSDADIVHAPTPADADAAALTQGSLKEPSNGATVVYRVAELTPDPEAGDADVTVEIRGPGVPGTRRLGIDGLPEAEAAALVSAQEPYPRGVDAVFATEDRIAALPRSTDLEVS